MKTHGFLLFLLGSAQLVASQTDVPLSSDALNSFPTCVQESQCLTNGATTYCGVNPTSGCICSKQVFQFFYFMVYCISAYGCSTDDVTTSTNVAVAECAKSGYDVNAELERLLGTVPPSFTYSIPSSMPTILGDPSSVFSRPSGTSNSNLDASSTPSSTKSSGLSTGAIIGIVVGGVFVVAIIAGLIVFCMKHKAKQNRLATSSAPPPVPQMPPLGPPPMVTPYGSPPPLPGYSPYVPPIYQGQQQPLIQQQLQPLMQGYQELEVQPAGYYGQTNETKETGITTTPVAPATASSPAPSIPSSYNQPQRFFQELPAQEGQISHAPISQAQEGRVYSEMPGNGQR